MTGVLTLAVALLTGTGVYLILDRKIFPSILGFTLLAHAANLVMLAAGGMAEAAPILTEGGDRTLLADPVPQAFVLTAIVISMAITIYLLAVFVRSGRDFGSDEICTPPVNDAERDPDRVRAELCGSRQLSP